MRCFACNRFSLKIVCRHCEAKFLAPKITTTTLKCGLVVISFFDYHEIELLLKTKYEPVGYFIYNYLAKLTFKHFSKNFDSDTIYNAVAIDDTVKKGYSHSAILANALSSKNIKVNFNILKAQNRVLYAGKSKEFRINNPRNFKIRKQLNNVILVDDIMTTGTTLTEAFFTVQNVSFAMVLAKA